MQLPGGIAAVLVLGLTGCPDVVEDPCRGITCSPGRACVQGLCVALATDARSSTDLARGDLARADRSLDALVQREAAADLPGGSDLVPDAPRDARHEALPADQRSPDAKPCSSTCGDLDGDLVVGAKDVAIAQQIVAKAITPTACQAAVGDVDLSGAISEADVRVLSALVDGRVASLSCAVACKTKCGDSNGDGVYSPIDTLLAINFAGAKSVPDACQFLAADVDGSGFVTPVDAAAITRQLSGTLASFSCFAPCNRPCGDVNGDGVVNGADATELDAILAGTALPDVCDLKAGDVNKDGTLSSEDRQAIPGGPLLCETH